MSFELRRLLLTTSRVLLDALDLVLDEETCLRSIYVGTKNFVHLNANCMPVKYPADWSQEAFHIPGLENGAFAPDTLEAIFLGIDADDKGYLNRSDLRRLMNTIGEEVDEEDLDEMIAMCHPSQEGAISGKEFISMFMNPYELFRDPKIEPGSAVCKLPVTKRPAAELRILDNVDSELNRAAEERRELYKELVTQGQVTGAEIRKIFARFQAIDKRNKGVITYQDFLVGMERKDSESSKRLFNLMDKDGSGEINLKEFMLGLSHLTQATHEERVQFAFNLFDTDKNGVIDRDELARIVRMSGPMSAQPQWIDRRVNELYESVNLRRNLNIDYDTFVLLAQENPDLISPNVIGEIS